MLLAVPTAAAAALEDEIALAEKHAPVVRLVEQLEDCGPGEPYEPIDVDALFDEPTVALRGPWNTADLVEFAYSDGAECDWELVFELARRALAADPGRPNSHG